MRVLLMVMALLAGANMGTSVASHEVRATNSLDEFINLQEIDRCLNVLECDDVTIEDKKPFLHYINQACDMNGIEVIDVLYQGGARKFLSSLLFSLSASSLASPAECED